MRFATSQGRSRDSVQSSDELWRYSPKFVLLATSDHDLRFYIYHFLSVSGWSGTIGASGADTAQPSSVRMRAASAGTSLTAEPIWRRLHRSRRSLSASSQPS